MFINTTQMPRYEFEIRYPFGDYDGYLEGTRNKMRMEAAVTQAELRAIRAGMTEAEISAEYQEVRERNKALGYSNE